MSLDDRDWYRDELRARAGMKPRWNTWRAGQSWTTQAKRPVRSSLRKVHPLLIALVWIAVLLVLHGLFKGFAR
jgi:hypothetical protein